MTAYEKSPLRHPHPISLPFFSLPLHVRRSKQFSCNTFSATGVKSMKVLIFGYIINLVNLMLVFCRALK